MSTVIEYVIAGGPQHGLVCPHPAPGVDAGSFAVASRDGQLCRVAARRASRTCQGTRVILLHPQATGEQFRTVLAA